MQHGCHTACHCDARHVRSRTLIPQRFVPLQTNPDAFLKGEAVSVPRYTMRAPSDVTPCASWFRRVKTRPAPALGNMRP